MKKRIIMGIFVLSIIAALACFVKLLDKYPDNKQYNENNIGELYYSSIDSEHIAETDNGIFFADNELLLVAKEGVSYKKIEKVSKKYDLKIVGYIEQTGDYQLLFNDSNSKEALESIAKELANEKYVEDAYLNYIFITNFDHIDYGDNWLVISDSRNFNNYISDPFSLDKFVRAWGANAINASLAWNYMDRIKEDINPIRIGLIDSGFDIDHEDLKFAQYYYDNGMNDTDKSYKDYDHGHGTHVVGTMAASSIGNTGICGIYPYALNDDQSSNLYAVSFRGITDKKENCCSAMMYKIGYAELIFQNVKVINTSLSNGDLAASYDDPEYLSELNNSAEYLGDFLNRLLNRGYDFVLITSAGNDSNDYVVKLSYDDEKKEFNLDNNKKTIRFDENGKKVVVSKINNKFYYEKSDDNDNNILYQVLGITNEKEQVFNPNNDLKENNGHLDSSLNSFVSAIPNNPKYKRLYDRIIVVGAVDSSLNIADFSNAGERVDIYAPGVSIYSTLPNNEYGLMQGTSMAAPHVAGVAADIWCVNNSLSGKQVKKIVCESVLSESIRGYPVIDAFVAVLKASEYDKKTTEKTDGIGVLMGWIAAADEFDADGINKTIMDAEIKLTSLNETKEYIVLSDQNGHFEAIIPSGKYTISISKIDEYESQSFITTVFENQVTYLDDWVKLQSNPITKQQSIIRKAVEEQVDGTIGLWAYNDYDGDGNYEAFAVISNNSEPNYTDDKHVKELKSIYFANHNGEVYMVKNSFSGDMCSYSDSDKNEIDGQRFFSVTTTAGGSYSEGLIFGVDGNYFFEPTVSCSYSRFNFDTHGKIYAVESTYLDEGGHVWYDHEMHFDKVTKEFYVDSEVS